VRTLTRGTGFSPSKISVQQEEYTGMKDGAKKDTNDDNSSKAHKCSYFNYHSRWNILLQETHLLHTAQHLKVTNCFDVST